MTFLVWVNYLLPYKYNPSRSVKICQLPKGKISWEEKKNFGKEAVAYQRASRQRRIAAWGIRKAIAFPLFKILQQ